MARKRSVAGVQLERAWLRDFFALLARETGELPSKPDPSADPQSFAKWMQQHARPVPHDEMDELRERMRELPVIKYRRARDEEVRNWIMWILFRQQCGDVAFHCNGSDDREDWEDLNSGGRFDLKICSLGSNLSKSNAKLSATLDALTNVIILKYPLKPGETKRLRARRLYDAIRAWRKAVQ